MVKVIECTAENLFDGLVKVADLYGLSLGKCVGFSSDGAANVAGKNNSVWTRVKEASPSCIQLKCTCHSLQLCVQHAFETLPGSVALMLTEIPSFFSHSSLRREKYMDLFKVMNDGDTPFTNPFTKFCSTRWLGRSKVIFNILTQWWELKGRM